MASTNRLTSSDSLYTSDDKFIVVLDSRNATFSLNGSMNSRATFDFEQPIQTTRDVLKFTCSVMSFTAPNSMYNVSSLNNQLKLLYTTGSTSFPVSIVIPSGNYNATTFMTKLRSLVTVADSGFAAGFGITLDNITNKFTLTHTTYSFHIMPTSTCYNVMGFDRNTEIICTVGATTSYAVYLPYTCNFLGVQNINIHFDSLVTSNLDSFNKSNSGIIQSIPVDSNMSLITYLKSTDYSFTIKQDVIDVVAISIKDDLENYIDFNNQHWNLTLYFSITKDVERFSHEQDFRHILRNGYGR